MKKKKKNDTMVGEKQSAAIKSRTILHIFIQFEM